MSSRPNRLPDWDENDLIALLTLEQITPLRYRNRFGDPNDNGRSYGGQLLAQTLMAASGSVESDRYVTAMQFLFLQGALHDLPIDFEVTPLQDGKRFSSRHVRGTQAGGRNVLDAHLTYAGPLPSPRHVVPTTALESPESLPRLRDIPTAWTGCIGALGAYSMAEKGCLDFRIPDAETTFTVLERPRARFWIRARMESPLARMHEGALAYMTDWWLNFSSIGSHAKELFDADRRIYIASLNQNIWFHRPVRADRWLHFETESAIAESGRGLSIARFHDETGAIVATASQECLMAYADT